MRSKVRKVLGYIIFLLVTVIVLGFSFMMPTLTAQMQDSIIQRQTNTQSIREVTLATTGVDEEISELLLFASSGYYTIDYEISFSDDMAAAKRATALEIADSLKSVQNNLLTPTSDALLDIEVTPSLATNSTQENARVLWDCYITDAAGTSVSIVLDDSTNKMLSFSMNARIKTNDDDNDAYGENFDESASSDGEVYATKNVFDEDTLWSSLETYVGTLKNYYGFKEARLLNIAESDNYYSDSSILNTVVFIDGKGSETECEIVLSADSFLQVYFNGFGRSKASVNLTTTVN